MSTLSILTTLDVYYPTFADQLVQSTQSYYAKEAETLSSSMQPAEYIVHVDARLQQESTRCERFFERQSKKEVMIVVQEELVANVSETIVAGAFNNLVKENDTESLRTLYRLLSVVNQVDIMHSAWSDYIKVCIPMDATDGQTFGVEMVQYPERDEEMVPALLSFKAHLDGVLRNSFNSDEMFSAYLRESFEWVVNRRRDKPAEYLAKYLDNILRKGDKGLASGESSVEEEMDRVLVLFRFVHGKDVFEAFYKKDLAKRLLLAKSASADAERSMLTKLKNGNPSLSPLSLFPPPSPPAGHHPPPAMSWPATDRGRMRSTVYAEIRGDVQRYRYLPGFYEIV